MTDDLYSKVIPPHQTARILIVDDEPVNLKLLDKMLRSQGYQNLELVQDPREVLDRYWDQQPELILLDINMPHMDGFEVMSQLQALDDPLLPPIIILTAQHGRDYLLRALAAGARDFVTKPFDRAELLMRVRNLIDVHRSHRLVHDQKAVLEDMVREANWDLIQTRQQIVRRLGRAAEYRDNETGYHIMRMSHISALLAKSMGWDDQAVELMSLASPMHDIGKIGVPDAVLLKPGRLDPEEWEVMKAHTTIGADLLDGDDSDLMSLARTIAISHHEKWDGTGYPYGLAGEAIPQSGRICAVADVFDALTSKRTYKKAWTEDEAVAYIVDQTGKHFDPEVVSHFYANLSDIIAIRQAFPDAE